MSAIASAIWLLAVASSIPVEVIVSVSGDFVALFRSWGNASLVPVKLIVMGMGQQFQTKLLLVLLMLLIMLKSSDSHAELDVLGKKSSE